MPRGITDRDWLATCQPVRVVTQSNVALPALLVMASGRIATQSKRAMSALLKMV